MITHFITYLLKRMAWLTGLYHVPEWDNVESLFSHLDPQEEVPGPAPEIKKGPAPRTFLYGGQAEPGKQETLIQLVESSTHKEDGLDWEFTRYDGKNKTPDFKPWSKWDDLVIYEREFSDTQVTNYKLVRPLVLQGKTNKLIAQELRKSSSWVDPLAAAVREMIKLREHASSPTD